MTRAFGPFRHHTLVSFSWDPACRNIFRAFYALQGRVAGGRVGGQELTRELSGDDAALARLAQIVVETPVASGAEGLPQLLDHLSHRWRRKRIGDLAREIDDARRRGDAEQLERLVQEKTDLSRAHHTGRGRPDDGR